MFPNLPVLDAINAKLQFMPSLNLEDVIFVCVQHLLETTGSLFENLIKLGANPNRIYVLGKFYSNNAITIDNLSALGINCFQSSLPNKYGNYSKYMVKDVKELWRYVQNNASGDTIIVLDEGGYCNNLVPDEIRNKTQNIVGIEQTTSGTHIKNTRSTKHPVIQVASSAVKKYFEPPLITQAVISKSLIKNNKVTKHTPIGVIGLGNIGSRLAQDLIMRRYNIYVHDIKENMTELFYKTLVCKNSKNIFNKVSFCKSPEDVFNSSEVIFGCTGSDVTENLNIENINGKKVLVSCSSGDIEYLSLLKKMNKTVKKNIKFDPLGDIIYSMRNNESRFEIIRGGFPINFDGSLESVPASEIQLTRGLILSGIVQAICQKPIKCKNNSLKLQLNPVLQQFILNTWLTECPERKKLYGYDMLSKFNDINWVKNLSGGHYYRNKILEDIFLE